MTRAAHEPVVVRRELGRTGMQISRVGFGAWQAGGAGRDPAQLARDDDQIVEAIHHAVGMGVNWVDTAAVYGRGHSEVVVGRALAGLPADTRPLVFTKCGQVFDSDQAPAPIRVGRPDSIRRELENSLRRLELERVDLYQMHWPAEDGTPIEEYWGTLLELKQEGKARAVGLSNHGVVALTRAERLGHVDSLQPALSLINRTAATDVVPWCRRNETGIIAYSPLYTGLLTGDFSRERVATLRADDWRLEDPEFGASRLTGNLAFVEVLKEVAQMRGSSVPAVAVAWVLSWPGVTAAIVGARISAHVDGWAEAANMVLSEPEMDTIAGAAAGIGDGPTRPLQADFELTG